MRYTVQILIVVTALGLVGCGGLDDFGDPFHNAAYRGDVITVQKFLSEGVPVDRRTDFGSYTALVLAGYTPYTNVVAVLIQHGADVNAQDQMGMSALHCAAYKGQTGTARLLVQHGADLSLTNSYGFTPLREAVGKGPPELVALLLNAGASVNVRDQRGWQPLHAALRSDALSTDARATIVAALLEHGADPNFANVGGWEDDSNHDSHIGYRPPGNPNRGNSPLAIAKSNGLTNIVELLESRGAKE